MLIALGATFNAGTAVLNRSLKHVDFSIVMFFYGVVGFSAALMMFTFKYFSTMVVRHPDQVDTTDSQVSTIDEVSKIEKVRSADEEVQLLTLERSDCLMLAFGVVMDAASIFSKTMAF